MADPEMSFAAGQALAFLKIAAFALPIIGGIMVLVKVVERQGKRKSARRKAGKRKLGGGK